MGINDKISEEPLIKKISEHRKRKVNVLIYNGIYTVGDFLDANIDTLLCSDITRWQLTGLQRILRYKYLGEYYKRSNALEKIYSHSPEKIPDRSAMFQRLGFVSVESICKTAEQLIKQSDPGKVRVIDVIAEIAKSGEDEYSKELAKSYLEYYDSYQIHKKREEKARLLKLKQEAINYRLKAITYEKADAEQQIDTPEAIEDEPKNYC